MIEGDLATFDAWIQHPNEDQLQPINPGITNKEILSNVLQGVGRTHSSNEVEAYESW